MSSKQMTVCSHDWRKWSSPAGTRFTTDRSGWLCVECEAWSDVDPTAAPDPSAEHLERAAPVPVYVVRRKAHADSIELVSLDYSYALEGCDMRNEEVVEFDMVPAGTLSAVAAEARARAFEELLALLRERKGAASSMYAGDTELGRSWGVVHGVLIKMEKDARALANKEEIKNGQR